MMRCLHLSGTGDTFASISSCFLKLSTSGFADSLLCMRYVIETSLTVPPSPSSGALQARGGTGVRETDLTRRCFVFLVTLTTGEIQRCHELGAQLGKVPEIYPIALLQRRNMHCLLSTLRAHAATV